MTAAANAAVPRNVGAGTGRSRRSRPRSRPCGNTSSAANSSSAGADSRRPGRKLLLGRYPVR